MPQVKTSTQEPCAERSPRPHTAAKRIGLVGAFVLGMVHVGCSPVPYGGCSVNADCSRGEVCLSDAIYPWVDDTETYLCGIDADGDGAVANPATDGRGVGPQYDTLHQYFKELKYDCDDSDPTRSPLVDEQCDGIDNNCNDLIDEGGDTWHLDEDQDGFAPDTKPEGMADEAWSISTCAATECMTEWGTFECVRTTEAQEVYVPTEEVLDEEALEAWPLYYVRPQGDCDDSARSVFPGSGDYAPDNQDNDCDGYDDLQFIQERSALTLTGERRGDGFGTAVVALVQEYEKEDGQFDLDDDLDEQEDDERDENEIPIVIGAPWADDGHGAIVFYDLFLTGYDAEVLHEMPWEEGTLYSGLGSTLANAGDWNGDEIDEVLVGVPGGLRGDSGQGTVVLLSYQAESGRHAIKTLGSWTGPDADVGAGEVVASFRELQPDDDNEDELELDDRAHLLVGAPQQSGDLGAAWWIHKSAVAEDATLNDAAHFQVTGVPGETALGRSVAGFRELDDDSLWMAVGGDGLDEAGAVYLFNLDILGPTASASDAICTYRGPAAGARAYHVSSSLFSIAVPQPQGVTTYEETLLIVSTLDPEQGPGTVWLVPVCDPSSPLGSDLDLDDVAVMTIHGPEDGAGLGLATVGLGDFNQDAFPDLLVGARRSGVETTDELPGAGSTYVILGPIEEGRNVTLVHPEPDEAHRQYWFEIRGDEAQDSFGAAHAYVNRDPFDNVLIGAPDRDAGQVSLVRGAAWRPPVPNEDSP